MHAATKKRPRQNNTRVYAADAPEYLEKKYNIIRSVHSQSKDRMKGVGPAFGYDGCRVYYTEGSLDEWAEAQLARPLTTQARKNTKTEKSAPAASIADKAGR